MKTNRILAIARTLALASGLLASMIDTSEASELPRTVGGARAFDYCALEQPAPELEQRAGDIEQAMADAAEYERAVGLLNATGLRLAARFDDDCPEMFRAATERFEATLAQYGEILRAQLRTDRARDRERRAVQRELAEWALRDQVARLTYSALRAPDATGSARWADRLATAHSSAIDAQATAYLRALVDRWGWIDRERFGRRAAEHAWLLAQHADDHPDFQSEVLALMQALLENDGIKPAHYAYLYDRLAVNEGRLQRFGTQPIWECTALNQLELAPVEEPEQLDERRAAMGLKPVRFDLDQMASTFCAGQRQ